jgi:hypothetical protein
VIVAHDRSATARHEAGHTAAELMAGRLPLSVTADWPKTQIVDGRRHDTFGEMLHDPEEVVMSKAMAPESIVTTLCGPLAEGVPIPQWPLESSAGTGDERKLATLATYLELDEEGWDSLVNRARDLTPSRAFRRLVGLITSALERCDELDADDLAFLIGPDARRAFGIREPEGELAWIT